MRAIRKAFALGHLRRSRPISERIVRTVLAFRPGMATRSTLTLEGNSADSPKRVLRLSPATARLPMLATDISRHCAMMRHIFRPSRFPIRHGGAQTGAGYERRRYGPLWRGANRRSHGEGDDVCSGEPSGVCQ
jgi:hypothetical protein